MNSPKLRCGVYDSSTIVLVASRDEFQSPHEPPLALGDIVSVNSGGPKMMVVDLNGDGIAVVSWRDGEGVPQELSIPLACLHRVSPL